MHKMGSPAVAAMTLRPGFRAIPSPAVVPGSKLTVSTRRDASTVHGIPHKVLCCLEALTVRQLQRYLRRMEAATPALPSTMIPCKCVNINVMTILWSSSKARVRQGQARDGKRWKALKLKPLPRAYIKFGCHHPPPGSSFQLLKQLWKSNHTIINNN